MAPSLERIPPGDEPPDQPAGAKARRRFAEIARHYSADAGLCAQLAEELLECYGEAGRHYHTVAHLEYMLEQLEPVAGRLADPDAVLFALLYHDAVYVPGRGDNEASSADLAAAHLVHLAFPPGRIARVRHMILATREHAACADTDTNYLLDADLAALGQVRSTYLRMVAAIRKEYARYDEATWRQGRARMLAHFLDRQPIYMTEYFRARHEQSARENLAYELALLGGTARKAD
ncbi:MAG: hypothetical protein LBE85_02750 [Candidatus Accumulibacter sp.]|jgi:predicted metal-dependent HD superfamily phosphohydrolase|nr:hypothetical protein [Accumulibacter sp.]